LLQAKKIRPRMKHNFIWNGIIDQQEKRERLQKMIIKFDSGYFVVISIQLVAVFGVLFF